MRRDRLRRGGVDVKSPNGRDADAPVLTIEGLTLFGGIAVGATEEVAAPAFAGAAAGDAQSDA